MLNKLKRSRIALRQDAGIEQCNNKGINGNGNVDERIVNGNFNGIENETDVSENEVSFGMNGKAQNEEPRSSKDDNAERRGHTDVNLEDGPNAGEEVVLFDEEHVREGSENGSIQFVDILLAVKYILKKKESIKGISAISSRLRRHMMMDKITFEMCKARSRRLGFARVLVEVDATKEFLDKIEINYVDGQKMVKMSKWVKESMERKDKEVSDEEDVLENMNRAVDSLIADEVLGSDGGGDFNVILKPKEWSDGSSSMNMEMSEFRDAINVVEIEDLCSSGFSFTWTNSLKNPLTTTLKKLDKIMIKEELIQRYKEVDAIFSPYLISDHSPSILKLKLSLSDIQRQLDGDPFNKELMESSVLIRKEYIEAAEDELKLLHQKAKINWLKEGDKNYAFFHSTLKARKHKSRNFLGKSAHVHPINNLDYFVQTKLSHEDALAMIRMVCNEEIKVALFDINSSKVTGPDGYTSYFFKKAWSYIREEIMTCITTASFFICIDREVFNMIMIKNIATTPSFKYHHGCKELKLTHMCFTDDLMVLCNDDKASLEVVKKAIKELSCMSGLFPNLSKSIIFFGSVNEDRKKQLLDVLPFKHGKFPMKYLGVPLISKKLSLSDCKSLIENMETGINNWINKLLSYVGRVQLIASVLSEMHQYWAFVYMLPVVVIKELDKLFKRPKDQGCLGIKPLHKWNEVILVSHIWKIIDRRNSLWVKWVDIVKLKGGSFWEAESGSNDSWGWKQLLEIRDKIKPFIRFKIGDGKRISMWYDNWCKLVHNGAWIWPREWLSLYPVLNQVEVPIFNQNKDTMWWINDCNNEVKYSHAFILWLAIQEKLLTHEKILGWQKGVDLKCPLCKTCPDSHDHLFFRFSYSAKVWKEMKSQGNISYDCYSLNNTIERLDARRLKNNIWQIVNKLILSATVYYVWNERNKRIFKNEAKNSEELVTTIKKYVTSMLMGLKVKSFGALVMVAKTWGLSLNDERLVPLI
ncbi:RNA-directed DNA polymerase, eukaryota, reverse transcriptase zinc-binding domain protein [Tanacetum coccineum]